MRPISENDFMHLGIGTPFLKVPPYQMGSHKERTTILTIWKSPMLNQVPLTSQTQVFKYRRLEVIQQSKPSSQKPPQLTSIKAS